MKNKIFEEKIKELGEYLPPYLKPKKHDTLNNCYFIGTDLYNLNLLLKKHSNIKDLAKFLDKKYHEEPDERIKRKIDDSLEQISRISKLENKPTIFTIANTKKQDSMEPFFPPIRNTSYGVAGNVIVYTVEQARRISRYINGKVDYVLVDAEKKILKSEQGKNPIDIGNLERVVFEIIDKSKVYSFKANDITVDAVDCFISQIKRPLSGKNTAIIGAGNIGSKLALSIVERGVNVKIYRRDKKKSKKIAEALNLIKTGELKAKVQSAESVLEACVDADIIVGCTPGIPVIEKKCIDVMKKDGIIIDIGKGSVGKKEIEYAISNGVKVVRADMRSGFEAVVTNIFGTINLIENVMGEREIKGQRIISGGIMGKEGDIIVDNYKKPQRIVGIANGEGDLKRKLSQQEDEKIESVKKELKI